MTKKFLGCPIKSVHTLNAAFTAYKGTNYVITTVSGVPAILNIYDLDSHRVKASFELQDSLNCWNHIVNTDGNVYLVSAGVLFRYKFDDNTLKNYGRLFEERECFVADNDDKGNIYIGSSPGGKVIKYDIRKDTVEDMGQVIPGATYVRSLSYHNGYIYCGVKGDSILKFIKINISDFSDKKEISLPEFSDGYLSELNWIYTSKTIEDKIIIHCKSEKGCPLLIYDTLKEKFIDGGYRGNFPGLYPSPQKDGRCYFVDEKILKEINIDSGEVSETDIRTLNVKNSVSSAFLIHKKTGAEVLTILDNNNGAVEFIDLANKKVWSEKLDLCNGTYYIQSLEAGDFKNSDNGIYLSGYCGDNAVRYDIDSKALTDIRVGQCEGMIGYEGIQYMGVYPGNILYRYNFKENKEKPALIGKMSEKQDRPFAMCAGDGMVFMGTVPDYGLRGGDIIIYDTKTGTNKVIKAPVPQQSIISLCYRDGILYGSTSVWGGLSATPDKEPAKVFMFDVNKMEMIKTFTPVFDENLAPGWIGGVYYDKDFLWAVTGNTLMCVDIDKEQVIKYATVDDYTYSQVRHRWRPTYIRKDSRGRIYANILGIHRFNKETMEFERITEETDGVFLFTFDGKDNIYYAVENKFYLIEAEELK
ncbi:MAG: hypothetical protein E7411_07180 [Ruminococcaceae bacterium]|nr:hypothetical protein [Oscillospiraceae bacterium]